MVIFRRDILWQSYFFDHKITEWSPWALECSPGDGEKSAPNSVGQIVKIDLTEVGGDESLCRSPLRPLP